MTTAVRWAFGDQLGPHFDDGGPIVFIESLRAFSRGPIHRAKAHIILSAMRHRAAELADRATLIHADDYTSALRDMPDRLRPRSVIDPTSHAARAFVRTIPALEILQSRGFLTAESEFDAWARDRKRLTMEDWYRRVRAARGVLMIDGQPVGGTWNLDADNRQPPPRGATRLGVQEPTWPAEDDIDAGVRRDLQAWERSGRVRLFGDDGPRRFAVTRDEALHALHEFIECRLPDFGRYEDAMLTDDPVMAHSLLSVPMNLGLLHPGEVIDRVVDAWHAGHAPLNSVEGVVRQILGWREFVWHCYWRFGPDYLDENALDATVDLPDWFSDLRSSQVTARCLAVTLRQVESWGWAHHIPRLMILGNWALQRGYRPAEVNAWFARSFVDGFAWAMPANVIGMALYADGGRMSTKPYAAGGAYINRMSDFCSGCHYRPSVRRGPQACPFTAGYWAFLDRHAARLAANHRMSRPLANLARLGDLAEVVAQERIRGSDAP